eukprot:CAMPEP_0206036622 /NCGR_PEP_ID=MMETSP1466-20131121/2897_1 /ASSEMBLY_ACC=CAM_ASM_001126 /TAXON_ID=44452 /ORGANISM="Pavlova gyrans, Strain CCMP608" /LENGTH=79 /DNA_ID=CAMNT_0053411111 /DNA_START=89 /DNA_END=328 /DNA_ORIENTATION=-
MDTSSRLEDRVYRNGIHKNTHRCPDVNDDRLQQMIPPALPEILNQYTKAVRKEQPKSEMELLKFSELYFRTMETRETSS